MRAARRALCLAALTAALSGVCSAGATPKPATPSWKTARPSLPEWAPKNPSPEFLRAARVLKPMPLETMRAPGRPEAENAARMKGAALMWLAAYEFFGTLSDQQIDHFLNTKQVMVPARCGVSLRSAGKKAARTWS